MLRGIGSSTTNSSSTEKPSKVAVKTAVPAAIASTTPSSSIAATPGSDEVHSAFTVPVVPSS